MMETISIETQQIETTNPATGKALSSYPQMTDIEVANAVRNSHKAFTSWRHKSLEERGEIIRNIGKKLLEHTDELAQLMTDEMGKLLSQSKHEVELCAAICDYTVKKAPEQLASEKRELMNGGEGIITYSPMGVIYGIQPWNYPSYQVIRYAIVNLMAGNMVLLKHASNVTGTGKLLEKIFNEAGLPEHAFQALIINHDQSDAIIKNNLVQGVTLTGSPSAGRIIAAKAAKVLKKTVMELGSNDAYLVLEDADVEAAAESCVKGRIYNNGETCIAAKRFIVVDAVYDEFKKAFVSKMKALKMGDPTKEETELGPMARKDLREELHQQVIESVEKGANVLCGGQMPQTDGYYYPATVLENLEPGMPAFDDELFGPVASLIRAKDTDDALRIANESQFGLGGGIFTKDKEKAIELAQNHFDTGMVFINSFGLANPEMPFGGIKNSGYGREHGGFGMREFVNVKSVILSE